MCFFLFVFLMWLPENFKCHVARIIFLLDGTSLEYFLKPNPDLVRGPNSPSFLEGLLDVSPEGEVWRVTCLDHPGAHGRARTRTWVAQIPVQSSLSLSLLQPLPCCQRETWSDTCWRARRAWTGANPSNYLPKDKWGSERSNVLSKVIEQKGFLSTFNAVALCPFILNYMLLIYNTNNLNCNYKHHNNGCLSCIRHQAKHCLQIISFIFHNNLMREILVSFL